MYWNQYNSKLIKVEDAVNFVKSNDHLVLAGGPIEPHGFIKYLSGIKEKVNNVKVSTLLSMFPHEVMTDVSYKGIFEFESLFHSGVQRMSNRLGLCSFIPTHLRNSAYGRLRSSGNPNVYVVTVSPMDKRGFFTTGPGTIYEQEMLSSADIVIVEVNPNFPRTFGDTLVHISEVDYIYEYDRTVPVLPDAEITPIDEMIGKYVSELIEDGSTIQLGIGGIPNASARELINKKDLGIHTEMLNDAIVDLYESGAITGNKKTIFPKKIVTSFTMGTKKVYDFIDDNPLVLHYSSAYTNNPFIISQNYKMVSVNTTLQVDFTGQCASESIVNEQISGTGGQVETAIGAQMSPGGKSIITLKSTADIKKRDSNEKVTVSNIVPFLEKGTIVTLPRTDVDYVVTEYGIASLKGASVKDRAKMLINISHPDFRQELTREAQKFGYI